MLRDYSWFQPAPRNFRVDKMRQRLWRRWGRYYQTTREYKLLKRLENERERVALEALQGGRNVFWLLPFRGTFRLTIAGFNSRGQQRDVEVIRYYMASCPHAMIPVCIWLIGKCADRFRLFGVDDFCRDLSPQVRKHVAKALRRLEAWWLLEEMMTLYPNDSRIQYFAKSPTSHRPFAERLSSYVRLVDDSHAGEVVTPSRMPFWASEGNWEHTPPKSVELIRRMLRRIRHWVRWGVN